MGEIWKEEAEPKPQKVKRITVKELHEARELAKQYRAENPDHAGGVVVVYDRVACGWMDILRDPHTWAPMSLAVDVSDNIWLAMGAMTMTARRDGSRSNNPAGPRPARGFLCLLS